MLNTANHLQAVRGTLASTMDLKAHLCSTLDTHSDTDGAFCPYSAYISPVFLHVSCKLADAYRNGPNVAVLPGIMGAVSGIVHKIVP
ncbi:unnamed protein product [Boreogadus saida]